MLEHVGISRELGMNELPCLINIIESLTSVVGSELVIYNQDDLMSLPVLSAVEIRAPDLYAWFQIKGIDEISLIRKIRLL